VTQVLGEEQVIQEHGFPVDDSNEEDDESVGQSGSRPE